MADILVRGQSADGTIKIFVAETSKLVGDAQKIHKSLPVATAALGRTLTIAAIMGVVFLFVLALAVFVSKE